MNRPLLLELAISCDCNGNVLHIIFDSADFIDSAHVPGNLMEMVDILTRAKLEGFFRDLREKGAALSWELPLSNGSRVEVMHLLGVTRDGAITVLASSASSRLIFLYDEFRGTINQKSGPLQILPQQAIYNARLQLFQAETLGEFMKINNELVNSQRKLLKSKQRLAQKSSQEQEALFERLFEHAPIGSAIVSMDYIVQRANAELCRITGYTRHELEGLRFPEITHPDDLQSDAEQARQLEAGLIDQYSVDKRYLRKDGSIAWIHLSVRLIRNLNGAPQYYLPMMLDINDRKKLEADLRQQAVALESGSRELQEMNAALRVLLGQREKDRLALHEQVLTNMRLLIAPHLERILEAFPQPTVQRHLKAVKQNFYDITSSFARTLNSEYRTLTAKEIRVADMIRSGLTSKEISFLLDISPRTAEYHRASIRRKLGLTDRSHNLYAYLNSLEQH